MMNRVSAPPPTVEELLQRIEQLEARVEGKHRLRRLMRSRGMLSVAAVLAALSVVASSYAGVPDSRSISAANPSKLPPFGKAGHYLRSNGKQWTSFPIQRQDIPNGYVDLSSDQTVDGKKLFGEVATFGRSTMGLDPSFNDAIELGSPVSNVESETPYIDFHYGTGTAEDYNVRLINDGTGQLSLTGKRLRLVGADIQFPNGTVQRTAASIDFSGAVRANGTISDLLGTGFTVQLISGGPGPAVQYKIAIPAGSFATFTPSQVIAPVPTVLLTSLDAGRTVYPVGEGLSGDGGYSLTVDAPQGATAFNFLVTQHVPA
jgi:hypothetical protein